MSGQKLEKPNQGAASVWTEFLERHFKHAYRMGKTRPELAKIFNLSRGQVNGKIDRLIAVNELNRRRDE